MLTEIYIKIQSDLHKSAVHANQFWQKFDYEL